MNFHGLKSFVRALAFVVVAGAFSQSAFAGAGNRYCPPPPPPCPPVPEIDPGSAAGAFTLLLGGVMTLADRRRSK